MRRRAANAVTAWLLGLFNHPWHIMGWCLFAEMVWLAMVYVRPENTFDRSPTYGLMRDIAGEDQWATAFAVCALQRGGAFFWRQGWFIALSNFCCAFMLTLCSVCFFWSGGLASSAAGLYVVMASQAWLLTMRRVFLNAAGQAP